MQEIFLRAIVYMCEEGSHAGGGEKAVKDAYSAQRACCFCRQCMAWHMHTMPCLIFMQSLLSASREAREDFAGVLIIVHSPSVHNAKGKSKRSPAGRQAVQVGRDHKNGRSRHRRFIYMAVQSMPAAAKRKCLLTCNIGVWLRVCVNVGKGEFGMFFSEVHLGLIYKAYGSGLFVLLGKCKKITDAEAFT